MRIAVVEPVGTGGLIHYAFQLCRALRAAGADVTLVTQTEYELEELDHDFPVVKLFRLWGPKSDADVTPAKQKLRRIGRALRWYRQWFRLIWFVRRGKFDVVQLGDIRFPGDALFVFLLRLYTRRLADVCHNVTRYSHVSGQFHGSFFSRTVYRFMYRWLFHVTFVHFEKNREEFLSIFKIDPRRVVAIPHGNEGIFEELQDPAINGLSVRRELQLPDNAKVVLMFGTLSRYKGLDLLIRAFSQVRRNVGRAHLVLAGFPSRDLDLRELRAQAESLGISNSVEIVPRYIPIDRVLAWMDLADVVVFPYHNVWQSGAVQIAATFGAPIVATRVGAMDEMLRDGETAILVPAANPTALADAILKILNDSVLALRLGANAYTDSRERFAWDNVAEVILNRYNSWASRPARSAATTPRDDSAELVGSAPRQGTTP